MGLFSRATELLSLGKSQTSNSPTENVIATAQPICKPWKPRIAAHACSHKIQITRSHGFCQVFYNFVNSQQSSSFSATFFTMRPSILRLSAVVSLVFTLISFILAAITLFAGRNTGTLENYAALRVCYFCDECRLLPRILLTFDVIARSTLPWPPRP